MARTLRSAIATVPATAATWVRPQARASWSAGQGMSDDKIEKAEKVRESVAASASSSFEQARPTGLDQVRELLFGAIQRDLEQRLGRSTSHASARLQDLEQEHRRRTEVRRFFSLN